jgi:hypothetical protein
MSLALCPGQVRSSSMPPCPGDLQQKLVWQSVMLECAANASCCEVSARAAGAAHGCQFGHTGPMQHVVPFLYV